jgi:parallel beta-helix repeat protein
MWNISITGNSILFQSSNTAFFANVGIRVYTDVYDGTNYPNGQIQGVTISGNTISNYKYGVYVINSQAKNIVVDGNSFFPKPFTSAGFTTGTTMNTEAVLVTEQSGAGETLTSFRELRFDNNMVWGAKYLISTQNGGGGAGTIDAPWGMTGNKLNYIQYIKTADIQAFSIYNAFSKNVGLYFLDRTWSGSALDNSLLDGTTSNSAYRYTFGYESGTNKMRFYTDDSATYIQFP